MKQLSQTPQSLAKISFLPLLTSPLDQDIGLVQGTGLNESVSFQGRSCWFTETLEVHTWLSGFNSEALFVRKFESRDHITISFSRGAVAQEVGITW